MKTLEQKCLNCDKVFDALLREIKRGNAKYCSKTCSQQKHKGRILVERKHFSCSNPECKNTLFITESNYNNRKNNSKSGLLFCSRSCKEICQTLGSSIDEIKPAHYGKGQFDYRKYALQEKEHICEKCGYNKIPEILEVHHKDINRDNNELSNLEIVCPNCHDEYHFLTKTGKWRKQDDSV